MKRSERKKVETGICTACVAKGSLKYKMVSAKRPHEIICNNCGNSIVVDMQPSVCFRCRGRYYPLDWHTPSGCPHCCASFVE